MLGLRIQWRANGQPVDGCAVLSIAAIEEEWCGFDAKKQYEKVVYLRSQTENLPSDCSCELWD